MNDWVVSARFFCHRTSRCRTSQLPPARNADDRGSRHPMDAHAPNGYRPRRGGSQPASRRPSPASLSRPPAEVAYAFPLSLRRSMINVSRVLGLPRRRVNRTFPSVAATRSLRNYPRLSSWVLDQTSWSDALLWLRLAFNHHRHQSAPPDRGGAQVNAVLSGLSDQLNELAVLDFCAAALSAG